MANPVHHTIHPLMLEDGWFYRHHPLPFPLGKTYSFDHPMEALKEILQATSPRPENYHHRFSMFKLFEIAKDAGKITEESFVPWQESFGDGFEGVQRIHLPKNVAWSYTRHGRLALFIVTNLTPRSGSRLQIFTSIGGPLGPNIHEIHIDQHNSGPFSCTLPEAAIVANIQHILSNSNDGER